MARVPTWLQAVLAVFGLLLGISLITDWWRDRRP